MDMHQLHLIGRAMHAYHQEHNGLPPAVLRDKDGRPLHSWRVLLLAYLDDGQIYKQVRLDEPWDSAHNAPLLAETPEVYRHVSKHSPGLSPYQVFVGADTAFERPGLNLRSDFTDGLGETLLVVETAELVPWAKPVDIEYSPDRPLPTLERWSKPMMIWCNLEYPRQGFHVCLADGHVRSLVESTPEATLRALITRNGGEKVRAADFE